METILAILGWLRKHRAFERVLLIGVGLLVALTWAYWHGRSIERHVQEVKQKESVIKEYNDARGEETKSITALAHGSDNDAAVRALMDICGAGRREAAAALHEHTASGK